MQGIFQYQVPGQKAQANQVQSKSSSPEGMNQFKGQEAPQPSFNKDIFTRILLLLVQLLEQITSSQNGGNQPHDCDAPPDATTKALGEEDGGASPPIDGPPDVTTLAIGEEDGGLPPPVDGPPDVTTLAIGEEDGGLPPPVDGPPDVTTLAIGEEDGGYVPPDVKY